jgi:hypothetical protein
MVCKNFGKAVLFGPAGAASALVSHAVTLVCIVPRAFLARCTIKKISSLRDIYQRVAQTGSAR